MKKEVEKKEKIKELVKAKEEFIKKREEDPRLAEIQDTINLRASVLELLAQKHPDRNKATELLAQAIKRKYFFYSIRDDKKDEMWFYQDGIYIPNGRSAIEEFCRTILQEAYTEGLSKAVYAKVKQDTKIDAEAFFKYDNLDEVPVLNGILNTRTREISSFTPHKIFFSKIPVEYNPLAKCPKLENYYKDVLADEEDIKVMEEFLGDGLSKRYDYQIALIQYGEGSNSKGISQSIIKKFFGSENYASVSLNQMTFDSHSIADLFGKFMNVAGDLDRRALKETGIFKELRSGTDDIQAKRKYMNDLKFRNFAKMIFACNEFPRVYDTTFGFWRSWIILNYPYKFISQEEYDKLEDKGNCKLKNPNIFEEVTSPEEMSGLMNKALDGLARLRKNKGYSSTKGTEEIKNFWMRKSSPFTAFCWDCLEEDTEKHISKKELRKSFSKYCKNHKLKGASDKEIKVVLQDLFGVTEDRKTQGYEQEYIWEGIKFKEIPSATSAIFFSKAIGNTPSMDFKKNVSIHSRLEISEQEKEEVLDD